MDKLLSYLNSLSKTDRAMFIAAVNTSENYLRKAISIKQKLGAGLCIKIERASGSAISRQDLRPDDWLEIWPELSAAAPATAQHRHDDPDPGPGHGGRQPPGRKNIMELGAEQPELYHATPDEKKP